MLLQMSLEVFLSQALPDGLYSCFSPCFLFCLILSFFSELLSPSFANIIFMFLPDSFLQPTGSLFLFLPFFPLFLSLPSFHFSLSLSSFPFSLFLSSFPFSLFLPSFPLFLHLPTLSFVFLPPPSSPYF